MSLPADVVDKLTNRRWRMSNLYTIQDKAGQVVPFRPNESQWQFWDDMWWLNIILKDRQRGFSTMIAMLILDSCMFRAHTQAGIIDITLPDAKKKLDKIRFGYESLPEALRIANPLTSDNKESLEWANGSRVDVSTSHRGGTLQILHVSEFGKIAARKPDVAKEIRTGAFNTVAAGNLVCVESTAEGSDGDFYEMCQEAQRLRNEARPLTQLDFKFHFFGWWMGSENTMPPHMVTVSPDLTAYFDKLEAQIGQEISPAHRAWYAKKSVTQRDEMKREFPSTPEEAFEAAIDGSYYAKEMAQARKDGRVTDVPYDQGFPVETFWDLGMDDSMTIWFRQRVGLQNRIIDYLEDSGEGLAHYARLLNEKGYLYGNHYMPHDAAVRELGTGISRQDKAEELGIKPITVVQRPRDIDSVLAGVEEVRTFLSTCVFDRTKCAQGIKALDGYRKQWDEKRGTFMRGPFHNWASHGADSFRTGAVALKHETLYTPGSVPRLTPVERDWAVIHGTDLNSVAMNLED